MSDISLKIDGLDKLTGDLGRFRKVLRNNSILGDIANRVRNMVTERTLRGVSADLTRFRPYSEKPIYISKQHRPSPKGGRRTSLTGKPMATVFYEGGYRQFAAATKGHATPNLFATGDMFRAFQARGGGAGSNRAQISFTRRFPAIKAAANNARRKFVGVHKGRELPVIQKMFARMVFRLARQQGL